MKVKVDGKRNTWARARAGGQRWGRGWGWGSGWGEGRAEAWEDLLLGEGLQIGAEGGLDVAHRLAPLHALERVDEVSRQLLHGEPVRALVEA